jgi:uncharacterized membrane protein YdjX (TVP38/TMEM64 family)
MSWLSDWKKKRLTTAEVLGKSFGYLKKKLGQAVSDEQVDELVEAADAATDKLEVIIAQLIQAKAPILPAAIATIAAAQAMAVVDAAIAAAANVVKDNN